MKYDLSVVLPGIRNEYFERVFNSIKRMCIKHTWELIIVGPNYPDKELLNNNNNVKYIYSKGSPTKCLDLGVSWAEGEYITYTSDDTVWANVGALDDCINLVNNNIVCVQYNEAPGFSDIPFDLDYWRGHYHQDVRDIPNTNPNWLLCMIFLMKKELYFNLGLDTRFEHINVNIIDLAFRHQKYGGKILISPSLVWKANYTHRERTDPVLAAFFEHDKPLICKTWEEDRPYKINTTWRDCPNIWERRFIHAP